MKDTLRLLPSIDELLNTPELLQLAQAHGRDLVVSAARATVEAVRREIIAASSDTPIGVDRESITIRVSKAVAKKLSPSVRRAINATGVILHTGLGRAAMPQAAIDAVNDVIAGYCTLAASIETGKRETRDIHFRDILTELTGAEAATAVNNNAAATMITLNTLAKGKEVIISRGQLVEIGGAFRMPEVMEMSGAILREVGTTNKTRLSDYAEAINENTGAILRVHHSNYKIVGFSEEPSIDDLAPLAKENNLWLIDDVGSGALVDISRYGMEREPLVTSSVIAGADAVCFSGDKLIGGPQCGIIVGKTSVVSAIKKNPLARALRISKMEVAALEATLRLFLDLDKLEANHPTYRMLSLTIEQLDPRAKAIAENLIANTGDKASVSVENGMSQVGSGSVPAETMPTKLISIRPREISAETLSRKLRHYPTPVFARVHQDTVLLDVRTILLNEDEIVCQAIASILCEEAPH